MFLIAILIRNLTDFPSRLAQLGLIHSRPPLVPHLPMSVITLIQAAPDLLLTTPERLIRIPITSTAGAKLAQPSLVHRSIGMKGFGTSIPRTTVVWVPFGYVSSRVSKLRDDVPSPRHSW